MWVIDHLHLHPHHLAATAELIYREFWTDVPGYTAAKMQARLEQAADPNRIPISLIARLGDAVIGAVNLIEDDGNGPPHVAPWLAGLVVTQSMRGQGVGSALVQACLAHASRLKYSVVHLGTDGPGFYEHLGGKTIEQRTNTFWIVRFDL
jgi:predicted N-acetyltransferase YhbS